MLDKNPKQVLCLVAGGSGGHITPAIVISFSWLKCNKNASLIFFGSTNEIDSTVFESHKSFNIKGKAFRESKHIKTPISQIPGKKIWLYPQFFTKLFVAFFKALFHFVKNRPIKIVSTGGLISIPICLAGKLLKIPIEIYELNVIPGKANKVLSRFASKIFVTFEKSKKFFNGATLTNYPLRFSSEDKILDKNEIIKKLLFNKNKKTIFFLGGSQGSFFLNQTIKEWIEKSDPTFCKNIQIIHQTGSLDKTDWSTFYRLNGIAAYTFSYEESINDFYSISDLVVCRGGAGTLFELEFFDRKSIIIPLKNRAADHQTENAIEMVKRHPELFKLCDQDELTKNPKLLSKLIDQHFLSNFTKERR